MKKSALAVILSLFSLNVMAEQPKSFEIHNTKIDAKVETCPKSEMDLAKEILELELAGMRYLRSKPECFESITAKYVHTSKNPDEAVESLVQVVDGSDKIESLNYDKKFFSYKVVFSVTSKDGKSFKDSFSFMTSAKAGAKKPKRGCALISASPDKVYVKASCL